jgi:hypothetical protein
MLRLEDIKKNAAIAGIDPTAPVKIMMAEPAGQNALLFRNDVGVKALGDEPEQARLRASWEAARTL